MSMFRKKGDEDFQFEGSGMVGKSSYTKRSLLKGEGEQAQDIINTILRKFISIRDLDMNITTTCSCQVCFP